MIKIEFKGLNEAIAGLKRLSSGKINKARIAAMNDAAISGYQAGKVEISRVFNNPTRWVIGGIRYVKASQSRSFSSIDLDFWGNKQGVSVEKILSAQIYGGARRYKRHEVALNRVGILPDGMFIVPGEGADVDQNGNMKPSQIVQIISFFRAFGEQGYRANMTTKNKSRIAGGSKSKQGFEYFVVSPDSHRTWSKGNGKAVGRRKMQPGIYKRIFFASGSAIKPVMIFVRAPRYGRRLDFFKVVGDAAQKQLAVSLDMYLNKMLKERGL